MREAEARGIMQAGHWISIASLGTLLIGALVLGGCTSDAAAEPTARADLVASVGPASLDHRERPSVQFPHGLHTEVMKEREKDCTLCHPAYSDGRLSFGFHYLDDRGEEGAEPGEVSLADLSDDELIDIYHDNCIGCHQETADAGAKAGPLACGDCHRRVPPYVSSLQPFGMDKSLHYRHIEATAEKCGLCHHRYDEAKRELVYVKGKESSCRDCHREHTEGNRSSFELAAHEQCIGCHRHPPAEIVVKADAARPELCLDCHDLQQQLAIKKIENPPRLERGQEDFLLLSASEADLDASKLRSVPFSHVDHEAATESCRVCHHDTLDSCTKCHSLKGTLEGQGVDLFRAMHAKVTDHSCVGCHDAKKEDVRCAGCHDQMEQARLPEAGCDVCHAGPLPVALESQRSRYRSIDDFRPSPSETALSFARDDIPETVEIGFLSKDFEPAKMPHRKIVEKLMQNISESAIATYFHGREDLVCQGCHHRSPTGEKPPLCGSCHEPGVPDLQLMKPALQGAYHRQCLGCHKSMRIEKPEDCSGCHAKKEETVRTAAASGVRRGDD
jgi:hypothetical protein